MECVARYNVLDIARYVINESWRNERPVSNLKLQKLLYFIQAVFLDTSRGKIKCFNEKIYAWDFGPVVYEAYKEFKKFGSNSIPYIEEYVCMDRGLWNSEVKKFTDNFLKKEDKDLIDGILEHFKNYSASQLVDLTHSQTPWQKSYKSINNEIKAEEIFNYFNKR